jgi:hypothetical protein
MERRRFLGSLLAVPMLAMAAGAAGMGGARRLRFTLSFANPSDRPLVSQAFWCYLPAELAGLQHLSGLEVSMPHVVERDLLGHRVLALSFAQLPPMGRQLVTVTAAVEMGGAQLAPAAPPGRGSDGLAAWLGPERFIESGAAEIAALAASLRRQGELETARAIYDWVRANLNYAGYIADDLGALAALASRSGDCTEYADLVVALARACGIPARMAGGYVVDHDSAPRPQDYHNWAQLYLDGAWRTVDAQKECWLDSPASYVVFRLYRDVATNPVGLAHRYRVQGGMEVRF